MVVGVDILATRDVLVATRAIRAGESFDPASAAFEARSDRHLPRDLVAGVDSLVGQRARRAISAGTVLRSSRFERATHIRRGERVKLVVRTGGLRIESAGRAREDGNVGDWIEAQNWSSRRLVLGRVQEDGSVHVEP